MAPAPRSYRIYKPVEELTLTFFVSNASPLPVVIDVDDYVKRVQISLQSTTSIDVQVEWEAAFQRSEESIDTPLGFGDLIHLEPGRGIGRKLRLRPTDSTVLATGEYKLDFAINDPNRSVRATTGEPWSGRVSLETTGIRLMVAPPRTVAEQIAMYEFLAFEALRSQRPAEAVRMYAQALRLAPDNLTILEGLGNAYLTQNQYREAIAAYERVLDGPRSHPASLKQLLALAYVAVSDESKAEQILRSLGQSEPAIAAEMQMLRDVVRRPARP